MEHPTVNPAEIIYAIILQSVLTALEHHLGEAVQTLPVEDKHLAREEVKIDIYLNPLYCSKQEMCCLAHHLQVVADCLTLVVENGTGALADFDSTNNLSYLASKI